ncbi:MAG: DnaA/Hda family protein [Phycisphaerales bacterium]|nr:DnaA/Hda family protein [Phycisphaerales bacterium]
MQHKSNQQDSSFSISRDEQRNGFAHSNTRSNMPHADEMIESKAPASHLVAGFIAPTHSLRSFDHATQDSIKIDPRDHLPTSTQQESTEHCDLCNGIMKHLIQTQGHNRVRRYFSGQVTLENPTESVIEVVAADRFTLDMIERRLGDPLRIAAQFVMGTIEPKIQYRVETARQTQSGKAPAQESNNARKGVETHPLANPVPSSFSHGAVKSRIPTCPSLNDFLVGTSNRLAFESVKQILQSRVESPPVFVHGSCGVGKTHLLRGATRYARSIHPGCKVRYTTGEAFTNGFVTAIRTRSVEAFQKKYRGLDLLCIDDIHLMAGKQATQHELLQIFNKLSLSGCTILLASDAHPRDIHRLDQALSSRFAAGLVVKIEDPDIELSRRLVSTIAAKRGVFLEPQAIQTVVDRVGVGSGASVRDLEGAILQIQAVARLIDSSSTTNQSSSSRGGSTMTPSMSHIRRALALRSGEQDSGIIRPIDLETIIASICQEMTVSKTDLKGKGRQKKVVLARELIVHIARNLTTKSFPEIAYAIGRPNHSTVITAAKRFKDRITNDQAIQVGCPHDGLPAGELAEMISARMSRA